MHLSYKDIGVYGLQDRAGRFSVPKNSPGDFLDQSFFYSVPTSFFALDPRVPRKLRELLTEAEGCLKSNFLTGASACARKMIYELSLLQETSGDNYEERIKLLKTKLPSVDPDFFDTLLTVHQVTSSKVHENSNDAWEARHLRLILATLREVLHEIYVVPALRQDRRQAVVALKAELLAEKAPRVTKTKGSGPKAPQ